jgi:4-hydroxybenzoate polyprenyltransferase
MKFLDYLFAARPMLHLPVWSVYLVALHYHFQLSKGAFGIANLAAMAGLTLLAAGAYYVNQVFDLETDSLNQKVGFIQNKIVSIRTLMISFLVVSFIPLAVSALYSKVLFFIYLQLFGFSVLYSIPPFMLKDRAISGLLTNAYCFGFLISISVMPNITQHNAGLLGWDNPLYFFLSVMGVHILTTLADSDGDRAVGKKTISLVLPRHINVALTIFAFVGASLVAYISEHELLLVVSVIAALTSASLLSSNDRRLLLFASKFPIILLTLLAGFFYPAYLLFVVAMILATRAYYKRRFEIIYPKLA